MGIIYKIEHKSSHKIYIGQTRRDLKTRIREHLKDHRGYYIDNALRKYGLKAFSIEIIEIVNNNDLLNDREHYWITFYNCVVPNGYNNTFGGIGHSLTEDTKRKISNSLKGRSHTEYEKIRISKSLKGRVSPMKGRKHSKKSVQAMIESRSGTNSPTARPIICLESGIYYISAKQASEQTGISRSSLCCALQKIQKTAGKLHWVYADEI